SIRFAEDAVANEMRFFDIRNEARITGDRHYLAGPVEARDYQDARNTLLRWPHPEDGPLMGTLTKRPGHSGESHRPSLRSTFFVIGESKKDVYVRSIGFDFWMRSAKRRLPFSIHIHDPQLPGRLAFESDFELEMVLSGLVRIRLSIRPNGLIIPPGKHLVIQIVAANDYQLFHGAEYPSFISISQGDRKRIGHELAQKILRSMWPAFLRRLNQNRFKLGEETYETNPIARGLELALKYDPLNQQAHSWYGWSRLRPWPEYSFRKLDRAKGPAWAVYGREAIRSTQQVIHWWLDHRAHENGYLVGGGNQWNDITKLYNKYLFLCGVTRDERLLDAIERYLDAHWNTGRMVNGAIYYLTDITHSVEEATYIQPALQVLRPGLPRHFYRDLLNAANLKKWLGRTSDGHLHFRSSFFNAAKIITDGEKGRDIPGCEPALVPARFLSWYSGHPEVRKMVNDWSRSWLEDTLNETTEKPEGALPRWVKFRTHELGATGYAPTNLVYEQFLASFQDTGDNRFLEPFVALLESGDSFGDLNWHIRNAPNLISWRILSGDARSDNQLRELSKAQIERFGEDAFFQRGIEYGEGKGMLKWILDKDEADLIECLKYVIRNNHRSLPIYGPSDPPTDRVYPWGRVTLPVMMLGGRLFDGRASDPVPTAAFIWDDLDPDLVSMVFDYQPNLVRMLVHNFKKTPEFAALRLMNLPEGRYQVIVAKDEDGDRKPDATAEGNEADLRRFTKHNLVFESGTNWVELKLLKRRKNEPRPDLAVTISQMTGQEFTVTLHNLGPASAENVEVSLRNIEPGRTDSSAVTTTNVGSIQGLTGFERQTVNLKFKIPEGATPSDFYLVVDPGNAIDEINESNNSYALSDGVPPPVESKPKSKAK
ncbi:MAG: CARDB domain-containing protein, partial [Planctomycetota bacterium]|nr:CARDB domain-containing protein [Planctomycetota bacterium]